MYYHRIVYQVACRNCRSIRLPESTNFWSDVEIQHMTRDELISKMNNFKNLQCEECGNFGKWLVFKIQLDDNDEVTDQYKINIFKENGKIYGKPEDGYYSPAEIEVAFMDIREKITEVQSQNFPSRPNGSAFIMVDFLNKEPYSRVSIFDIDGLSIREVSMFIDAITGKKQFNGISPSLKSKLEAAFVDLKKDTKNPLVIAHLKDKHNEVNIYLIAKDPTEEAYYGILENKFMPQRKIMEIPLSNIKAMEVEEVQMKPFRARPYIENGVKE